MSSESGNPRTGDDGLADESMAALSGAGAARRDSMLSALQSAVVLEGGRRRARRIAFRRVGSVGLVAVLGIAIFVGWPTSPSIVPFVENDSKATVAPAVSRIVRLSSQPGALERLAFAKPIDPAEYVVDDHAFVAVLASIGRPTGLVRRGSRVMLTSFTPDPIREPLEAEQEGASEAGTPAQGR